MSTNLTPQTQEFIEKIEQIARNPAEFNEEKVMAAMQRHYALLGMNMPEIQVVQDMVIGYEITKGKARDKALVATWMRVHGQALLTILDSYVDVWLTALDAFLTQTRNAVRVTAWNAVPNVGDNVSQDVGWNAAPIAPMLNAEVDNPQIQKFLEVAIELFTAFEHGLGCYFPMQDSLVLVPMPRILVDEKERLHSTERPAVDWKDGAKFYFIHGVQFEKALWQETADVNLEFKTRFF
jgi:hypothetical protein